MKPSGDDEMSSPQNIYFCAKFSVCESILVFHTSSWLVIAKRAETKKEEVVKIFPLHVHPAHLHFSRISGLRLLSGTTFLKLP